MNHVRVKQALKGGSQFYRDKRIGVAATLCGAPVTDKDIDYKTAGTKKFRVSGWECCVRCLATRDVLEAGR